MAFIQSGVQDPDVIKEGTHRFAPDMHAKKAKRTEVIMRNAKIEETGRCPFDVHTTLVEGQCCFCVTFGRGRRNRMSDILGYKGYSLPVQTFFKLTGAIFESLESFGFCRVRCERVAGGRGSSPWHQEYWTEHHDMTIQVTTYDTVGDVGGC